MEIALINILVLLLAFIIGLIGVFKDNKEAKDFNRLKILIVFIFLGLILSTLAEIRKYRNELDEKDLRNSQYVSVIRRADTTLNRVDSNLYVSDSILNNTTTSISQLTDVQNSSRKLNDSLAKELRIQMETNLEAKRIVIRTEEAAKLITRSIDEQTGGTSFCYVDVRIFPSWDKNSDFQSKPRYTETIVLHNDGEYSLRNVHIEIQKPYIASQHLRNNISIEPWVMTPLNDEYFIPKKSMNPIYTGFLPDSLLDKDEIVYDIHFFLGNGNQYTQVVKLAKAHGGWPPASKIIDTNNPAYKYEYVHPLYPTKPVNWNYRRPMMNTYRK